MQGSILSGLHALLVFWWATHILAQGDVCLGNSPFESNVERSENSDDDAWMWGLARNSHVVSLMDIRQEPMTSITDVLTDQNVSSSYKDFVNHDDADNSFRLPERLSSNGSRNGREATQDYSAIPEPMLFDLVRPLGAKHGEIELNTLAVFPWRAINRDVERDPFGSGQTTRDLGGIEWAPEIEYAFADGWAIEFELPFEKATLEAYKFALQGTFGTAFDNHFIHGFQMIVEPTTNWTLWNSTLLYLVGVRLDEVWSALLMVGGRMNLAGPDNDATFERLFNASLFREIGEHVVLGVEVNHAVGNRGRNQTIVVPQAHLEIGRFWELQSGIGMGVFDEGSEQSFIMRLIYAR
ncbi:MAG TPA: hypothetical protein PKD64_18805 [Pirellulaceae bacterium]|nr:hypothetical protein [Pirellulaceae bacterium]HMO94241.1 hypothetical protein [Pirellulaceae bacterium]HMP70804.1 hypothetical protein [Pirellulaceae bacterium]